MKLHILSIKTAVCLISSLLLAGSMAYAQNTLRGKVTDASGQPLPGVTVMVEGTGNGTTTDLNGNYTLSVPSGAKIVFSCLGMATIQREYKGQAINVSMSEDSLFIEDVVVVGYGTAKKGNLTSAVSAIKGEELLKAPSTNVSQVLAGRLPAFLRCRNQESRVLTRLH